MELLLQGVPLEMSIVPGRSGQSPIIRPGLFIEARIWSW